MISLGVPLLIISIIIIILFFFSTPQIENIENIEPIYYIPYVLTYPFWNASTRHTRNMSYDLRGDIPIMNQALMPFNMSSIAPVNYIPVM